jgi:hypothetical protein
MTIPRKPDCENHPLFDFRDKATTLTRARAEQIVTAIAGWNPKAADELANLLLKLEQAVAASNDNRVDAVIEVIDLLVEMAFQESEAYCEYLNEYRESVNQRCRRAFGKAPHDPTEGPSEKPPSRMS